MTKKQKPRHKEIHLGRQTKNYQPAIYSVTYKDSYRKYNYKREDKIPLDKYKGVVSDFFQEMTKKVINERHKLVLPYSLGTVLLKSSRLKKPLISYITNEEGKLKRKVNFLLHSLGKIYRIVWENKYTTEKIKYLKTDVYYTQRFYKFKYLKGKRANSLGIGGRAIYEYVMNTLKDPTKKLV